MRPRTGAMGKPFYQIWFLMLALLVFVTGCGGNGNGSSVARNSSLQFSLDWPARTRAIPQTANSAIVTVAYKGQEVGRTTLNRPQGSDDASAAGFLFEKLPAGQVTVTVTAYPELDGAGTALAQGVSTATLLKNATTPQAATMASTAATLELSADETSFTQGTDLVLTLTAKDASGALVLLKTDGAQDAVTWSTDAPTIVTIEGGSQGATVHGVLAGTANVTAKFVVNDAGATIEKSIGLTVTAPPTTSVAFKMPWTFNGAVAPAGWQSVKATVLSGTNVVEAKTIERSGTEGQVTFDGLTVGGNYKMKYEVFGQAGAAGSPLTQDTAPIDAGAGTTAEYVFGTAPFGKAAISLKPDSSVMLQDGSLRLGNGYYAGIFTQVVYSDNTTGELGGEVSWTSSNSSVARNESASVFKGVGNGTATLTATHGGIPMSVLITVY